MKEVACRRILKGATLRVVCLEDKGCASASRACCGSGLGLKHVMARHGGIAWLRSE